MKDLTKKDYINILIEGITMYFLLVSFLLIMMGNDFSYSSSDNFYFIKGASTKSILLWMIVIFQSLVTWKLMKIRKIPKELKVILTYTFVVWITCYAIIDVGYHDGGFLRSYSYTHIDVEEKPSLRILFFVMEFAWLLIRYVHNQYFCSKSSTNQEK